MTKNFLMKEIQLNIIPFSPTVTKLEVGLFVKHLMDQFSRMYWKSISQQSLPVTTLYPEMVAEMYPHFENEHLSDFGKNNLWFL